MPVKFVVVVVVLVTVCVAVGAGVIGGLVMLGDGVVVVAVVVSS